MRKKIINYLLIISIFFLIFSIVSTYARYSSEYNKTTNMNFTKWNIKINNSDISNNSNITSSLIPTLESNPHIAENVIVPTSTGYFDIEIDCSETNLSFTYTIDINNLNSEIKDYKVTGYSLNNSPTITYDGSLITENILSEDNIDSISYRFFVEWDDSAENITSNSEDTNLCINNSIGQIDVNISFNQITDDELI